LAISSEDWRTEIISFL
jgi:hypothetical protein